MRNSAPMGLPATDKQFTVSGASVVLQMNKLLFCAPIKTILPLRRDKEMKNGYSFV
jgi:hypothetical protein